MKRSPVDFNSLLITSFRASFQPTLPFVRTYSKRRSVGIRVRISRVYFEKPSEVFSSVAKRMTTAGVSALFEVEFGIDFRLVNELVRPVLPQELYVLLLQGRLVLLKMILGHP